LNKLLPKGGSTGYKKDFKAKNTFDDAVEVPKGIRKGKSKHNRNQKSKDKDGFVSVLDQKRKPNRTSDKRRKPKRKRN